MISCNIFDVTFVTWLDTELDKRGWNRSELARRAGFTPGALTHIYSGKRKPGINLCNAIAKAMNIQPEEVQRAAGLLPPSSNRNAHLEKMLYKIELLPPEEQKRIDHQIDFILSEIERAEKEHVEEDKEI
jgi:transcriptional regulator with XRE-family HTH domain